MVHVSNIQVGARANSPSDLLSRGQAVKVKVMSVAGANVLTDRRFDSDMNVAVDLDNVGDSNIGDAEETT